MRLTKLLLAITVGASPMSSLFGAGTTTSSTKDKDSNSSINLKDDMVELNINEMEIEDFIKMVAKIDNKNILIPTSVRGKISYVSKRPIPKKSAFHILQMLLKDKGFTMTDSGKGYYVIARLADAQKDSPNLQNQATEETIHTAILPVKNMDAEKISNNLKNFLSRSGRLVVSGETNSIVVTDLPENVKVIKTLISKLDQKPNLEIEFVELKNVKVAEALQQMKSIADAIFNQKIDREKVVLFKNDQNNLLGIIAERQQINKLLKYVEKLDKEGKTTKQETYVVKLNNATAEEVMKNLTTLVSKKKYEKDELRPTISSDKELNSLIILSTAEEYKEFLSLIEELDVERKQVYVKAKIVEISESKARNLGLKYGINAFTIDEGGLYTLASTLNGGSPIAFSGVTIPSNLQKGFGLGIGLNFLNSNGVSNTLSEPSILCVNNQESSIYVGQTESILTSSTQGASTTALAQNSYSRQDIGLTLKIKPRISNDNKVIINIDATLEDVVAGSGGGLPTTTKREVKTMAVVNDGEAVVVGGLIKDKITETDNSVPLLGDIPLLGYLFKDKIYKVDKINLVIILTPYVINKSSDLDKLRENLRQLSKFETDVVNKLVSDGVEPKNFMKPSFLEIDNGLESSDKDKKGK